SVARRQDARDYPGDFWNLAVHICTDALSRDVRHPDLDAIDLSWWPGRPGMVRGANWCGAARPSPKHAYPLQGGLQRRRDGDNVCRCPAYNVLVFASR